MTFVTRNLKQHLTHWEVTSDGYGGFTFGTPTTYLCRWEDKNVLFTNELGEEVVSSAVVLLDTSLSVGDYVALGDNTGVSDPTTLSDAHRIRQKNRVTDLRNVTSLHKVFL